MAQYTVKFSCGHEGVVRLFGPDTERHRKIKWLEENGTCPECQRQAYKEWRLKVGLIGRIEFDYHTQNYCLVADGETYPHKNNLKAHGYRWSDEYPGTEGFKKWTKYGENAADLAREFQSLGGKIEEEEHL